jgi:hypothetical protein
MEVSSGRKLSLEDSKNAAGGVVSAEMEISFDCELSLEDSQNIALHLLGDTFLFILFLIASEALSQN